MKQNIRIVFLFLIIGLIGCDTNTQSNNKHAIKKNSINNLGNYIETKKIIGEWMKDCQKGTGSIIIPKTLDTALMEITFNQIQINAKIEIDSTAANTVLLFKLIEPYDLGRGGTQLHWSDFSKDSIIAKMAFIDTVNASLTWYGFYDKKVKRRIWTDGFDIFSFDRTKNKTTIKKCEDFVFVNPSQ